MDLKEIFAQHNPLSEDCLNELEKCVTLVNVSKREILLHQGEVCRYFYFTRSGLMRVSHEKDGVEDTLLFGSEGDVFTSVHSWHADEPSLFTLSAIEDSEIYLLSYSDMNALSDKFPDLVLWMRNLLIEQLYAFEKRYEFFGIQDAASRYRNFMYRRNGIMASVPIKYIAQYLKIRPEYLSRIRRNIFTDNSD